MAISDCPKGVNKIRDFPQEEHKTKPEQEQSTTACGKPPWLGLRLPTDPPGAFQGAALPVGTTTQGG